MSDDLVARLRHAWDERERQLDEDERVALAVIGVNAHADLIGGKSPARWEIPPDSSSIYSTERIPILRVRHTWRREADHIIRHDPARVLAEVERGRRDIAAKRRILDDHPHLAVDGCCGRCIYGEMRIGGRQGWPCVTVRALAEAEGLI